MSNQSITRYYLENTSGTSNKFYEVVLFDRFILKRWGAIGAPKGQMKIEHNGTFYDAREAAYAKYAKGYDYTDQGTTYELSERARAFMEQAVDRKDAHSMVEGVNHALRAVTHSRNLEQEMDKDRQRRGEEGISHPDQVDVLLARAQSLVPLVAQSPMEHVAEIAEVREAAEEWRNKMRRLDSQLETLDILLTTSA